MTVGPQMTWAKGVERVPDRVKWLRNHIRRILIDPESDLSDEESWALYDDLDTLFTAVQLYSYPGQYLKADPSVDRIAETLLKLEEDVSGQGAYPSPCEAHIRFAEPIEVNAFLEERSLTTKSAVGPMTRLIAEEIQAMLESLSR